MSVRDNVRMSKIMCTPIKVDVRTYVRSAANKYNSSAGHHEQKNKKTTGQIKFLAVTIK